MAAAETRCLEKSFRVSSRQVGEVVQLALNAQARRFELALTTARIELKTEFKGELAALRARLQDQIDSSRAHIANMEYNLLGIEEDRRMVEAKRAMEEAAREKRALEAARVAREQTAEAMERSRQEAMLAVESARQETRAAMEAAAEAKLEATRALSDGSRAAKAAMEAAAEAKQEASRALSHGSRAAEAAMEAAVEAKQEATRALSHGSRAAEAAAEAKEEATRAISHGSRAAEVAIETAVEAKEEATRALSNGSLAAQTAMKAAVEAKQEAMCALSNGSRIAMAAMEAAEEAKQEATRAISSGSQAAETAMEAAVEAREEAKIAVAIGSHTANAAMEAKLEANLALSNAAESADTAVETISEAIREAKVAITSEAKAAALEAVEVAKREAMSAPFTESPAAYANELELQRGHEADAEQFTSTLRNKDIRRQTKQGSDRKLMEEQCRALELMIADDRVTTSEVAEAAACPSHTPPGVEESAMLFVGGFDDDDVPDSVRTGLRCGEVHSETTVGGAYCTAEYDDHNDAFEDRAMLAVKNTRVYGHEMKGSTVVLVTGLPPPPQKKDGGSDRQQQRELVVEGQLRRALDGYEVTGLGKRTEDWGFTLLRFADERRALAAISDFDGSPVETLYGDAFGSDGKCVLDLQRLTLEDANLLTRAVRKVKAAAYCGEDHKCTVLVSGMRKGSGFERTPGGAFSDEKRLPHEERDREARYVLDMLKVSASTEDVAWCGPPIAGLVLVTYDSAESAWEASAKLNGAGIAIGSDAISTVLRAEKVYKRDRSTRKVTLNRKLVASLKAAHANHKLSSLTDGRIKSQNMAMNKRVERLEHDLDELRVAASQKLNDQQPEVVHDDRGKADAVLSLLQSLGLVVKDGDGGFMAPPSAPDALVEVGILRKNGNSYELVSPVSKNNFLTLETLVDMNLLEKVDSSYRVPPPHRLDAVDATSASNSALLRAFMEGAVPDMVKEQKRREGALRRIATQHTSRIGIFEERLAQLTASLENKPDREQVADMQQRLETTLRSNSDNDESLQNVVHNLRAEMSRKTSRFDVSRIVEAALSNAKEEIFLGFSKRPNESPGWSQAIRPTSADAVSDSVAKTSLHAKHPALAPLDNRRAAEAALAAAAKVRQDAFDCPENGTTTTTAAQWAAAAATAAVLGLSMNTITRDVPVDVPEPPVFPIPAKSKPRNVKPVYQAVPQKLNLASYPHGRPGALRSLHQRTDDTKKNDIRAESPSLQLDLRRPVDEVRKAASPSIFEKEQRREDDVVCNTQDPDDSGENVHAESSILRVDLRSSVEESLGDEEVMLTPK